MIELFYKIQKKQKNAILLLIGEGDLKHEIQNKIEQLNIENKVFILGYRGDTNCLFNAMDVFLFPSKYEGLGIAAIEAQTNGLPVFCSNAIPSEAKITETFATFELSDNIDDIADRICSMKVFNNREEAYKKTISSGYVIDDVCKQL